MFGAIGTEGYLVIFGGYALISWLCYGWGKRSGVMLGTHATFMMLLANGYIATKDGRMEGTSELIKHPEAKSPDEIFQQAMKNWGDNGQDQ